MEKKVKTAPYLPFQTFTSALDNIAAVGVPNIIDRHSFPSFSGANVSATLIALKFFGLVDGDGKPEDALHTLAKDKDGRKKAIKALLEKHYGNVFALDLTRATPPQFDGAFTAELYNISGDTKVKAKTFFIKAAQFAEIPISKLLLKKLRTSGPRKPRKPNKGDAGAATNGKTPIVLDIDDSAGITTSKTVELETGGTLTLTLGINILELRGRDRDFVFDLIDKIEAYETGSETSHDKGVPS